MSFERDGVVFRYTSEEAEAERQKLFQEKVLPAAREYFANEPEVDHVSCFVAQYWNDEGLDDVHVTVRPSKVGATSVDEVEGALLAADDLPSLFAAYCEYGDQNEDESVNYRLFATISRTGDVVREKQVRPWLDGVQCLYDEDFEPRGQDDTQLEAQLALDARLAGSNVAARPPGLLDRLKNLFKT